MKVQEVILKALVGSLKWSDAAEIIGISDRSLRRWRQRYEQCGYDGLYDRRKRRPSPKRIPIYYAQFGEGRRHAHADASGAGGDRKPRGFLRFVQRPGEPFLRDTKGWRKGGPESVDTVGTGATRAGDQNDSGVFAAGAGADVRRSCKLMILNKLVALTGIEQVNGQPWQAELGLSGCKYVRLVLVALP